MYDLCEPINTSLNNKNTYLLTSKYTINKYNSIPIPYFPRRNAFSSLVPAIAKDRTVLLLYLVPSALYCFYNNLAFVNLSAFDPTTYYLLLQFRVVITGVLFQVREKKQDFNIYN